MRFWIVAALLFYLLWFVYLCDAEGTVDRRSPPSTAANPAQLLAEVLFRSPLAPALLAAARRGSSGQRRLGLRGALAKGPPFSERHSHSSCGVSTVPHSRIVGGSPAVPGSWPWIAALGFSSRHHATVDFLCAGSLVSSRHVVSAAHCFAAEFKLAVVRLGEHNLLSDRDGENPLDVMPEDVRSHPRYNKENNDNDIAVILLNEDVHYTSRIRPICLPRPRKMQEDLVDTWPYIAGWGAKHYEGPKSNVLRELQMPVVSEDVCRDAYSDFDNVIVDERVICAGFLEGGKDACQGDSGGPLMLRYKGRYYLIGVVSLGYRCAEPDLPGVYTRVSTFLHWIDDYMKKHR